MKLSLADDRAMTLRIVSWMVQMRIRSLERRAQFSKRVRELV